MVTVEINGTHRANLCLGLQGLDQNHLSLPCPPHPHSSSILSRLRFSLRCFCLLLCCWYFEFNTHCSLIWSLPVTVPNNWKFLNGWHASMAAPGRGAPGERGGMSRGKRCFFCRHCSLLGVHSTGQTLGPTGGLWKTPVPETYPFPVPCSHVLV